jgi:apolipoprotein D and lipocalin family protein
MGNSASASSSLPPLQVVPNCETSRFMGQWFVIGVKPTFLETTCSNAIEKYTRQENNNNNKKDKMDVQVEFTYNNDEPITSKFKTLYQKCWIQGEDKSNSASWIVSPFWPLKLDFPIIELDDDKYSYCVVGQNSRSYCWIMARQPKMSNQLYEEITKKLVEKHQYSLDGFRKVPQYWTKEERDKRGVTAEQIPDSWLNKQLN